MRPVRSNLSRPPLVNPVPPDTLAPAARKRWMDVLPRLAQAGTVDVDTLVTYCQVWSRWRQAEETIAKTSQLIKRPRGGVAASPMVAIAHQAAAEVRALERRLGLDTSPEVASDNGGHGASLVTRRVLAARIQHHEISITKWQREGLPVAHRGRKGKPSLYDETAVRAWLQAREDAAQTQAPDLIVSRSRKELAQAVEAEQRVAIKAHQLIAIDEVDRIWSAQVAAIRARLLAWPTAHADRLHRVAALEGAAGVERVLQEIVYDALRELAATTASVQTRRRRKPAKATSAKRRTRP